MTLEPPMIRVGLLGHGQAGAILHAPLIEAAGDFRITSVATSRLASTGVWASMRARASCSLSPRVVMRRWSCCSRGQTTSKRP